MLNVIRNITLGLICLMSPFAYAQSDKDYAPLSVGAKYEYSGFKGLTSKVIVEIVSVSGGEANFTQTIKTVDPSGIINNKGVFKVTDEGMTEFLYHGSNPAAVNVRLKFPLKVGTKWTEANPNLPGKFFAHKVGALGVSVKVPAGEFKNCVRIDHYNSDGTKNSSSWYAPGIGLVKSFADGVLTKLSGLPR